MTRLTDDELVRQWADKHRGVVYRDMGMIAAVVARLDEVEHLRADNRTLATRVQRLTDSNNTFEKASEVALADADRAEKERDEARAEVEDRKREQESSDRWWRQEKRVADQKCRDAEYLKTAAQQANAELVAGLRDALPHLREIAGGSMLGSAAVESLEALLARQGAEVFQEKD